MAFSNNRKLNIAYSHSLSKVSEREDQAPYESSKQGGHNVQGSLVWGDIVPFASDTIQADLNVANNPTIIKKYTQQVLTPIPGSNNYAWYLNDTGAYIRNWIDEVSVIDTAGNLSYGYTIKLYQNNGTQIPYDLFNIDPFAGVILFNTSQNPIELSLSVPLKLTVYTYIGESVSDKLEGISKSLTWQAPVLSKSIQDPSVLTPDEGDRYIVPIGGTGTWLNKDTQIATYTAGSWTYLLPVKGFTAYVLDNSATNNFNGTEWVNIGGSSSANNVTTDTLFFNYLLSASDDNVQRALETLDRAIYDVNTIYTIDANTTISDFGIYKVDCTTGNITITLDQIVDVNGRYSPVKIIKTDNTSNTVTIQTTQDIGNLGNSVLLEKQDNFIYMISDYSTVSSIGSWLVFNKDLFIPDSETIQNINLTKSTLTYTLSSTPVYPEKADVYLNGVNLNYTSDYTITNDEITLIENSIGYMIDSTDTLRIKWR